MLQGVRGKEVTQIVEADLLTACPFQNLGQLFRTAAGSRVEFSFLGEGNIHREVQLSRQRTSAFKVGFGRITLRLDALVFG